MEFHPVANLFPLMDDAQLEELANDIAANGQKVDILLVEDKATGTKKVADGRNRYLACDRKGIPPKFKVWDGDGSLVSLVWSLNGPRRHLSSSQKAAVAAEMEELFAAEAKGRQREGQRRGAETTNRARSPHDRIQEGIPESAKPSNQPVPSAAKSKVTPRLSTQPAPSPAAPQARDLAAAAVGTNPRYVSDAKAVRQKSPELHELVRKGEITLPQAKRRIEQQERKQELAEKASAAETLVKEKAAGGVMPWTLLAGDCIGQMARLPAGSVPLVVADPPYNLQRDYHGQGKAADDLPDNDYIEWSCRWMTEVRRVLTPGGTFALIVSPDYADDLGVVCRRRLGLSRWAYVIWYETFGMSRARNFGRCSRHILFFGNDARKHAFNEVAVMGPSVRLVMGDKRANPAGKIFDDVWGIPWISDGDDVRTVVRYDPLGRIQGNHPEKVPGFDNQLPVALVRRIIECCSDPGDLVLDPFNGTGTTGVGAIAAGRRYLGIEKNAAAVAVSDDRVRVAYAVATAKPD